MRKTVTQLLAAAAGIVLSTLGAAASPADAAFGNSQAPRAPSAAASDALAAPGARLWTHRYSHSSKNDYANAVAVSPSGNTVFITGASPAAGSASATIAYDALTGTRLWVSRSAAVAISAAVSPDGNMVFVGGALGSGQGRDFDTRAYDAATGAQRWASRYNSPADGYDAVLSVAASPDGRTVFVTGQSTTIAYNAATGAQLWAARNSAVSAISLAVSPDGTTVFVTGNGGGYLTIAYDAATGETRWLRRYKGPAPALGPTLAHSIAVSPDGATVFVTGDSTGAGGEEDYATIAYNAATGATRWVKRYSYGPLSDATSVAVSPSGTAVFVTGFNQRSRNSGDRYLTVAYNAATGATLWASRGPAGYFNAYVAVSPDGKSVFVAASSPQGISRSDDYATTAYDALTGATLWTRRYNGPASSADQVRAMAASPTQNIVFVTGLSAGVSSGWDYATLAYAS